MFPIIFRPDFFADRLYYQHFQIGALGPELHKETVTLERRCFSSFSVMSYVYRHLVAHQRNFCRSRDHVEPDRLGSRKINFQWIIA